MAAAPQLLFVDLSGNGLGHDTVRLGLLATAARWRRESRWQGTPLVDALRSLAAAVAPAPVVQVSAGSSPNAEDPVVDSQTMQTIRWGCNDVCAPLVAVLDALVRGTCTLETLHAADPPIQLGSSSPVHPPAHAPGTETPTADAGHTADVWPAGSRSPPPRAGTRRQRAPVLAPVGHATSS